MKVTLVKKILTDGSPCKKCADVMARLEASDQMKYIDEVVVADERNENSKGMQLAAKYDVKRAPFFIVEQLGQELEIYTIYFKFVKEVIDKKGNNCV